LLDNQDAPPRKFRHYLARSICNYAIEELYRRQAQPGQLDEGCAEVLARDVEDLFEAEWLKELLVNTFRATRDYYMENNPKAWTLFAKRHIEPTIFDRRPQPYDSLALELGYENAKQASTAVINVIRTLNRRWREVLAEQTGIFESEAESEIRQSFKAAKHIDFRRLIIALVAGDESPVGHFPLASDQLSHLVDLANDEFSALVDAEKAILLESYLNTPINELIESSKLPSQVGNSTFVQLLEQDTAAADDLKSLSTAFELEAKNRASALPRTVALLMRLATIILARDRHSVKISSLDSNTLTRATEDALTCSWLDGQIRELFTAATSEHPPTDPHCPED
jgi:hypothetical protein